MKTKALLFLMFVTVLFTACKDEKSIDSLEVVKPEAVDNSFKVELHVIVKKEDDFALFYTEDGSINFFDVKPVWQGVKGSDTEQIVTFTLPEDVYPTQFRFDLGLKLDQEDIVIKGVKMTYKGKVFEAFGTKFFEFFRADDNLCTADITTGNVTAKLVEGNKVKTASIYPQQDILGPELIKLAK